MKDQKTYTGKELKALGAVQGPELGEILRIVNESAHTDDQVKALIAQYKPAPVIEQRDSPAPCQYNITCDNDLEANNVAIVKATMDVVLRTPVVVEGAVMPDACPAGPVGTIPVGGVVAVKDAIIPGMHSADICCSLMATVFNKAKPCDVLDAAHKATHFGYGGREAERAIKLSSELAEAIADLPYPAVRAAAHTHMGTQGDGNHFLYVGTLESSGQTVVVTHHGSRGFGAKVYKEGMKLAMKWRDKLSPSTGNTNAWIPFDRDDGRAYWDALQVVRAWTKENHASLHDLTVDSAGIAVETRFWNEHKKRVASHTTEEIMKAETQGLDVRFYTGVTDISELPSAYKNAETVVRDMKAFSLAETVDRVLPYGSIMAGDGNRDAPWRNKRKERDVKRQSARRDKRSRY